MNYRIQDEMNPTPGFEIEAALDRARTALLDDLQPRGCWEGRLCSSALATAVAVVALHRVDANLHAEPIRRGLDYLAASLNADGGWGDSPGSLSNVSASLLGWSAMTCSSGSAIHRAAAERVEAWLIREAGSLRPEDLERAVTRRYGKDRTFAGPILALCALAGRLGPSAEAWKRVPQLPFELAILPPGWFHAVRLTVVSYALPALIAIGLARHRHRPSACSVTRAIRDRVTPKVIEIARRMQPEGGGYEEASPLTAFVTLNLAASGWKDHEVVRRGAAFLLASMRADGSWPIDTNLATWVTALSVMALDQAPDGLSRLPEGGRAAIREWLLGQQHRTVHPLTFGAPGGWAWTDLPGGMPDADDTPAVLLALRRLGAIDARVRAAAAQGISWLLDLQNGDGGIPTFSRGWGKLPFDRSCPDLTAHTMLALAEWRRDMEDTLGRRVDAAFRRMLRYLRRSQRTDGAWIPLWFGNQWDPVEENPVYGTARVVIALRGLRPFGVPGIDRLLCRGLAWLRSAQRADGAWGDRAGMRPSVEESAMALAALAPDGWDEAVERGAGALLRLTDGGRAFPEAPIGLYFARLWYSERLYPRVFAVHALGVLSRTQRIDRRGTSAVQ